jgi:hypothetical protein
LRTQTTVSGGRSPEPNVKAAGDGPLEAQWAYLRDLLEQGAVEKARAWIEEMARQWPEDEVVHHYVRVLAPPRISVRRGHRGPSRQAERTWLRKHARDYPGQWLAVLADRLVAADPDLDVVLAAIRPTPEARRALLHFQPGTAE